MPNVYTKYITAQPSLLLLPSANFSLPLNIEEECDAGRSVPSIFRRTFVHTGNRKNRMFELKYLGRCVTFLFQ